MARIPYPRDVPADLVESQRPQELPKEHQHLNQQAARNVYRILAHEPALLEELRAYISMTWNRSNLTNRQRELVILAAAQSIESAYEWHQHVRIALLEGITRKEILAISKNEFSSFGETETILIRYAWTAARQATTDNDLKALQEAFNVKTVVSITALISVYVALETHLSAFDIETEEPFVGWELSGLKRD